MMRVIKQLKRLLREMVDAPSLKTVKVRLDEGLRNLIPLKMSLLIAGCLELDHVLSQNALSGKEP